METDYWAQLENVQDCIGQIDGRMAELQREKERYEAMGHKIVALMIEEQTSGNL